MMSCRGAGCLYGWGHYHMITKESGANMFDKLEVFETRYEELNQKMYDPSIVSNPDVYTEIMKEYKNLTPLVEKYREYKKAKETEEEARQMLSEGGMDKDFREMLELEL